jgi:hypothetical protein
MCVAQEITDNDLQLITRSMIYHIKSRRITLVQNCCLVGMYREGVTEVSQAELLVRRYLGNLGTNMYVHFCCLLPPLIVRV